MLLALDAYTEVQVTQEQENLFKGCLRGDLRSQMDFYQNYQGQVFNSAYRILRDRVSAEDITQETFITAFERLSEIREIEKVGGWMNRIAVNKSLNALKKDKGRWLSLDQNDIPESEELNDDWLDDIDVDKVYSAIEDLPPGYRTILNLFLIEDYSHAEIGEELGITESTSRSQYTRAKKKLKEIFHDHASR
jgi:RNA polymerase sigma factor (sigma-70 family)